MIIHPKETISSTRRLLVLMPDANINIAHLAQHVLEITSLDTVTIVFIANAVDEKDEYRVRRRLMTLAASMRDECARVETFFTLDQNWARVLDSIYQRGDVIVCHAEQTQKNGTSLSRELEDLLMAPVYTLSGLYLQKKQQRFFSFPSVAKFAIPIVIFLGFLVIQLPIESTMSGAAHHILMSFTVIVEYAALAVWATFSNIF